MYSQFVKNMEWFLELNKGDENHNYRYDLVKKLEPLKDIEIFKQLKDIDEKHLNELMHLIWSIGENQDKFPSFKSLSWELWGYGFDGKPSNVNTEELEEQLRIIDLLLSTQYWH